MPNVGKPSGACHRCKRMKVKCDEVEPSCKRCRKADVDCKYGPKPEMFRYSNQMARDQRSSNTATSSARATSKDRSVSLQMIEENHNPVYQFNSKPQMTTSDWCDRAIKYFFWTHTLPADDNIGSGYLDSLETYCSSRTTRSYLDDALLASALVNMSRKVEFPWMARMALHHRSQALSYLRAALEDPLELCKDDLLLALFLVERSEIMDLDTKVFPIWQNHTAGLSAVLRFRGDTIFDSEIGTQLFRWINPQLGAKDFAYGTDYYIPAAPIRYASQSGAEISAMMGRAVILVRNLGSVVKGDAPAETTIHQIADEALAMDALLETYQHLDNSLPGLVLPHHDKIFQTLRRLGIPIKIFPSLLEATFCSGYLQTRIRVLRLAKLCFEMITNDASSYSRSQMLDDKLCSILESLAGTIPAMLGFDSVTTTFGPSDTHASERGSVVGALWATFACSPIASCVELHKYNPSLEAWALEVHTYIGNKFGVKLALAYRNYYQSRDSFTSLSHMWKTTSSKVVSETGYKMRPPMDGPLLF